MKTFKITWQMKDRYRPFKRTNTVSANSEDDAKKAFFKTFGSRNEILEINEVTEE